MGSADMTVVMQVGGSYTTIIMLVLMVAVFYFLLIRPNKKRTQAQARMVEAITIGTRVMTGSGIYGTVVEMGDRQTVIQTSPNSTVTVLKQAVAKVIGDGDEDDLSTPGAIGTTPVPESFDETQSLDEINSLDQTDHESRYDDTGTGQQPDDGDPQSSKGQ